MIRNKTHHWIAGLAVALLCVPVSASAENVLHGRISFDAGGTLLKGTEESDWSSGSVNTLVLPGDTVWVDNGGTTELEFSGGSFLRMADGSKAEIAAMPPNASIRGWVGSFYVQRLSRSSGDFVFYTPAGIVEVENDTAVRVDILEDGLTTVSTRWGRATVRTDAGGSVTAHSGRRVYVEAGLLPSQPTPFDRSGGDAFDEWNRERAEFLATGSTRTPASVQIKSDTLGVSDLDRYGEWVYTDNRHYWRPTVVVDYTPYRYGYWNHVSSVGSVWVGNYPFSYITSHHGYWDYHGRYGWVWSYEPRWSPAYCATVRYGDYFVWAPVNRHYRPVYPTTSAHFSIGGVSFGFWGTSYTHVDRLYHGPSYVNYAYHDTFRNYYGRDNVTINIWNINTRGDHRVRVPYNDSVTTVRDYTPRRSIRGASTFLASGVSASSRAQRLESSVGRSSFSRASRTGESFVRTEASRGSSSRVRTARIDQSAPDYTRASRSNPVRARSTVIGGDSRGRTASEDSRGTVITRSDVNRSATARTGLSRTTSERPSVSRGRMERGSARTGNVDRSSTLRGTTERTTVPRSTSERSSSTRGSTPQRTDIDPRSDGDRFNARTPVTTYARTPSRTSTRGGTTSVDRSSSRDASASTRTRTSIPDAASRSRSSATSSRNVGRTSIPDASRNSSAETRSRATARTSAPRVSAPDRSRPSVSTSRSRSDVTPPSQPSTRSRVTAPTRSRTPLETSTPRSSGRVTTRSAPPSRSMSTPSSRQSSVRAPAPSSSSRSTITRPSTSSRSISQPSGPSRSSISRPSTSSRSSSGRSISRSSSSRGDITSGRSSSRSRGR